MEADYGDRVEVTIYGESDEGKPLFQVKVSAIHLCINLSVIEQQRCSFSFSLSILSMGSRF